MSNTHSAWGKDNITIIGVWGTWGAIAREYLFRLGGKVRMPFPIFPVHFFPRPPMQTQNFVFSHYDVSAIKLNFAFNQLVFVEYENIMDNYDEQQ